MTIDDLSATTGVSSRTIRYYQTLGLLPSPKVRGRVGHYDDRHVERLKLIDELREEGLNLQAISWLLGGAGRVDSEELRRLKRAVLDGWVRDAPITLRTKDLRRQLGSDDPAVEGRAVSLGLLGPSEEPDHATVMLPTVLAAGAELAEMGVEVEQMLDVLEVLRVHAGAVADAYVDMYDETVLGPWEARGRPSEEFAAIREAVERIRPLAGEALLSVFNQLMAERIAARLSERGPTD